jgi:bacterioferritin-associated ferredoxin
MELLKEAAPKCAFFRRVGKVGLAVCDSVRLQDIVRAVRAKSASLKATEQPIDTGTAAGKCRHAGRVKGRPASIDAAQVRGMKAQGMQRTSPRRWVLAVRASTGRCNRKRHTGTRLDGFDQELSLSIRDAALHTRT